MSARNQTLIKIAISLAAVALLIYVLRGVNLGKVIAILLETNLWYLIAVIPIQGLSILIRLVRWQYQLMPFKKVSLRTLFSPLLISYAVGNITVTALGAVPRVYLLNRHTGINNSIGAGTFIQEYYLDSVAVVLWATLVPFFVPLPAEFSRVQLFLSIFLLLLIAIGVAIWRRSSLVITVLKKRGLWGKALSLLPSWITNNLDSFGEGLSASFATPQYALVILATTLANWIVEATIFWGLLMGLNIPFSFLQASAVMIFSYIALGIPSAPTALGTLDAAVVTLVLANGGTSEEALAFLVLMRVYLAGPSTVIGLALAWREGWLLTSTGRSKGS